MEAIVETAYGKVRGTQINGVLAFKAIPYGAGVSGQHRFQRASAPTPWTDVRDATEFGPSSIQTFNPAPVVAIDGELRDQSEECLILNVWTKDTSGNKPVMVWLHGGGFYGGSGSAPYYDGANVAEHEDVVIVTINHRLGMLGFLYLEDIFGDQFAGSGNVGLLDCIDALKWVKENIANFGGDPGNVTIYGQSGGCGKLLHLLAMPEANGLYHRAIGESGASSITWAQLGEPSIDFATRIRDDFLAFLGTDGASADALLKAPTDVVLRAQEAVMNKWRPNSGTVSRQVVYPVIDGKTIIDHPCEALRKGLVPPIPLMIGSNLHEVMFFLWTQDAAVRADPSSFKMSDADLADFFSSLAGKEAAAELVATYRRTIPNASDLERYVLSTSESYRLGSIRVAEAAAEGGNPNSYVYVFDWESPVLPYGAGHTAEVAFVFDNLESYGLTRGIPEAAPLAKTVSGTWANFARTGVPSHPTLPEWPRYDTARRPTMVLGSNKVVDDLYGEERKAWDWF